MGIAQSKNNSDSINWDNINTESMSSTLPALQKISKDAEQLISNLNIAQNINMDENDTDSENENLFSWINNIDNVNTNNTNNTNNNNNIDFSDTSPFISEDMYKYLMNNSDKENSSSNKEQVGGAINEDSSTSSTSSSIRKGHDGSKNKGKKDNKKKNNRRITESSSVLSGGNLSYLSSSAHTSENKYESSADSVNETSVSVGNNQMLTSSIGTSDINMISSDNN
jgi:hypothetical protein